MSGSIIGWKREIRGSYKRKEYVEGTNHIWRLNEWCQRTGASECLIDRRYKQKRYNYRYSETILISIQVKSECYTAFSYTSTNEQICRICTN